MYPNIRMRRLRNGKIGNLIRETSLGVDDLIYPMFVDETAESIVEVPSMEGVLRLPLSEVVSEARNVADLGISSLMLFGIPSQKDEKGSSAYGDNDIVQQATRAIKEELGDDMVVITDVCMCEYTSHGHCGIIDNETHDVINDETLPILGKIAASHARAGADMVAPSGMMDGMVGAIRQSLDQENFSDVPIMSYAAKYCSAFYGPFRDAADSCYCFGDRSTYQMDPANSDEALREVELDIMEGGDIVMVKPALPYLDIIYRIKQEFGMPTAAYSVSGEYSMLKAAAQQGWLDEKKVMYESLMSIKRAGADMIITYFAKEMAQLLNE
ncbi:porphobilinogen synthase [Methanohalophilus euhalobius]|uniref:Delta-aminolevulinic acid dehydratase n=1 Tax=Methanohalophilus euhalobius TaxID=51203 RepID=A0A285EYZ6_9EURY|nr:MULTISPECIES: porphobilinogen synthase [Methanohalophilus]RSD34626.1 MAG: porphobilinogen synthase [Methanohalophilus sp.]ODV50653.1 MAG: porphobilinogen synthase [Methanohalophilus sp. 2-GBenrich]RSD36303.1 MAG: porphobilinogen synthase [Methanohalophilus sp.]RXG34713.1 porphobilinogen synthase [Methanohalophilus sp. WG1-DM]TCL12628.1 porphobilinogen synthase [Methanohalophilus euhalobius]